MEVLKVQNLKKIFVKANKKVTVIDGVTFSLNAGECLGIVGLSGCGKSTTARIVAKLLKADDGKIFLCGEDVTNATDLKKFYRNVQMIFQTPEESFNPRKTLGWSIAEPLRNYGEKNIDEKVFELLAEVGLPKNYSERYPHEVSGGECQRAAIARAIALSPKILICDEATSALDVTIQSQIVALIKNLCRKKNISCLFITHDLILLKKIADRAVVMHAGKIVEEGTPAEILNNPKNNFSRELVNAGFDENF